jgi:hypothetical protein
LKDCKHYTFSAELFGNQFDPSAIASRVAAVNVDSAQVSAVLERHRTLPSFALLPQEFVASFYSNKQSVCASPYFDRSKRVENPGAPVA